MSDWKSPKEKPEGEPKVLVVYWSQFFGAWTLEYGIGFYDDPEYYEDGAGDGWSIWDTEKPIRCFAWRPLPKPPSHPDVEPHQSETPIYEGAKE